MREISCPVAETDVQSCPAVTTVQQDGGHHRARAGVMEVGEESKTDEYTTYFNQRIQIPESGNVSTTSSLW